MEVRLLLQPLSVGSQLGEALAERGSDAMSFWLLAAWAQESGLNQLRPIISGVRQRGGRAEAVLGVDQGIATYEGLRLALEVFDDVYLFHDGDRTFHPKLYAIENDTQSRIVIGSGNVTEGGLYRNFEASTAVDLDRSDPLDESLRLKARGYFEAFIASGMPSRRLDRRLLRELRDGGAVLPAAERRRQERDRRRREQPLLRRVFGPRVSGLPGAPPAQRPPRTQRRGARGGRGAGAGAGTGAGVIGTGSVTASWWKKLTISDAMRKPAASHQRKDVILGKARHPIDQKTYFKNYFFAGVAWTQQPMRTGRIKELAVIPFDVYVERRNLGVFNMSVDHADSRVANQNNAPTWLNWSSLGAQILSRNYTGWYLLLARYSNGGFRLTLTRAQPSPAVIPGAARV